MAFPLKPAVLGTRKLLRLQPHCTINRQQKSSLKLFIYKTDVGSMQLIPKKCYGDESYPI